MHEIICPHCSKAFKVDESGYADILKQVRDSDFAQQLHERLELAEKDKFNAIELAKSEVGSEMQKTAAAKDIEIQELKAKLDAGDVEKKLAVTEALAASEKKRDSLASELEQLKQENLAATQLAEATLAREILNTATTKDTEIHNLKSRLEAQDVSQKLAITEALRTQIKDRDDAIERLRDMKARLSTKMVGESLEQHCETEFNRIRATAFPRAYFEKDNNARAGSKGDFIFRDICCTGIFTGTRE